MATEMSGRVSSMMSLVSTKSEVGLIFVVKTELDSLVKVGKWQAKHHHKIEIYCRIKN